MASQRLPDQTQVYELFYSHQGLTLTAHISSGKTQAIMHLLGFENSGNILLLI